MIARGELLLLLLLCWQRHVTAFSVSRDSSTSSPTENSTASLTEVFVTTKLVGTTAADTDTPGYITSPVLPNSEVTSNKTIKEINSTESSTDTLTVSPETNKVSNEIVTELSGNNRDIVSLATSNEPYFSAVPVNKRYTTIYRSKTTDIIALTDPIATTILHDIEVPHTTTSTITESPSPTTIITTESSNSTTITTEFQNPTTTTTTIAESPSLTTTTITTESSSPTTEHTTSTSLAAATELTDVTDNLQLLETRNDLIKYETTKTAIKVGTTTNKEVNTEHSAKLMESTVRTTTELTTSTQQDEQRSDTSSVTTDGKKSSTLYTVKSTYKRPKKLEIVQPKPYLRDPNDNSWRNESISSLGIVFRPNDATNKTLARVKNRTELEPPIVPPENAPEPELKQRLDKLSSARRAGKRPPTPAGHRDYETEAPAFYDVAMDEVTPGSAGDEEGGAGAELRAADFFREFQALLDAGTSTTPPTPPPRPSSTQYFPPSSVKHFRELVEEVRPEPFVPTFEQPGPHGPLYAALVRRLPPCDVRCGGSTSGAVELSPDYELHYYIPEQEEQAAPLPHLPAHPVLALYTPRALS